jgi:hypothetical protein
MSSDEREKLREHIANFVASLEREAAVLRPRLTEIEADLAEWRPMLESLSGGNKDGYSPDRREAAPAPRGGSRDTFSQPTEVSPHDILRLARGIVREAGSTGIKAIEVAKRIVPGYDPDSDNRKFENRVYSVLKHREDEFVRVTEGMWAEIAQVKSDQGGGQLDLLAAT